MAFDQTKVGQLTAGLMEQLDGQFDEDCEFGDLLIVAEVLGPHGSSITVQVTSPRKHANIGLMTVALDVLKAN